MRERFNDLSDRAVETYNTASRSVYNTAREYPGTIAAIILGLGITAALVWAARRAGGWRNLQQEALDRAREGYDYAREGYGKARDVVAERVKGTQQQYTE
jgi:uncharacterized membrane protein YccC